MGKRGPKPKPPDEKQGVPRMVRMSPDEESIVDRARGETPFATYVREAAVEKATRALRRKGTVRS